MIKYTHDTTVCDGKEEQDAADKVSSQDQWLKFQKLYSSC